MRFAPFRFYLLCIFISLLSSPAFPDESRPSLIGTDPSDTDRFRGWELMVLPERDIVFRPYDVMRLAGIKEGDIVGDIGCGGGYFTFKLARRVGSSGWVLAVDSSIPQDLEEYLAGMVNDRKENVFQNVTVIRSRKDDVMLPAKTLDVAFLCNVALLLRKTDAGTAEGGKNSADPEDNVKMVKSVFRAIKPGGRLILIEYLADEGEDVSSDKVKGGLVATDPEAVKANYGRIGFEFREGFEIFTGEEYLKNVKYFMELPQYALYGPIQKYFYPKRMIFYIFEKPSSGKAKVE
ncbi:MAG: methyltransferase domain-containing protein [Candidatus Omnitrophica bacterium]|nr:methyltransferase domain-containing protein [Candidatus Omnitrophota bacterium]